MKIKKNETNGIECLETDLTVSKNSYRILRSSVTEKASDKMEYLMRLIQGEKVKATIFSPTNVVGHISREEIEKCYNKRDWNVDGNNEIQYDKKYEEKLYQEVLQEFGDKNLGFALNFQEPLRFIKSIIEIGKEIKMGKEISFILGYDKSGNEYPKIIKSNKDSINFGDGASYYVSDMIDFVKNNNVDLCVDAMGRNHGINESVYIKHKDILKYLIDNNFINENVINKDIINKVINTEKQIKNEKDIFMPIL